ncbi:ABC transporter G family member 29-like [Physcomitrium patens]|uniref:ABC transporter G family member 29-like n=1 Tax=Physcomitrium patens TaxID=3218 RepID=UPI003CCD7313
MDASTSPEGIDIWGSRQASTSGGAACRSRSRAFNVGSDMFITGNTTPSRRHEEAEHDEEALKWAALEKLPTYDRLQTTILQKNLGSRVVHEEVDVSKIGYDKRREIIDNLLRVADEDNERFLAKLRNRIDQYRYFLGWL